MQPKSKFDSYQNYMSFYLLEKTLESLNYLKCVLRCSKMINCAFLIADQTNKVCFLFSESFKVDTFDRLNELSIDSMSTFYYIKDV